MRDKNIVVPGEVVASDYKLLPGDGTKRVGKNVIAIKYGLLHTENNLVKVIPLSGAYLPRVGNTIIGEVVDLTFNGWIIDIMAPHLAFLPLSEVRARVSRSDISEFLNIGDITVAKINSVKLRSIDLTMRDEGLHKISNGLIVKVSPMRVARIIGKKGSMVNAIKQATDTKIIVGQNGLIWILGKDADKELIAKEAVELVAKKPLLDGLTEKIKEFINDKLKKIIKKEEKKDK